MLPLLPVNYAFAAEPLSYEGTVIYYDDSESCYKIGSATELRAFANLVNSGNDFEGVTFKLTSNIDFEGTGIEPIGNESIPFQGIFDGNNKRITRLSLYSTPEAPDYRGLFRYVGNKGTVKNLSIDGTFTGKNYTGIVVGYNNGVISNCYSFVGTVTGNDYVGGIAGYNNGIISDCSSFNNEVKGSNYVGGLVGYSENEIINSWASNFVNSSEYVGGLVGYNTGLITGCYHEGSFRGDSNYRSEVGGIAGQNEGLISKCYNEGKITGKYYVGGIVGKNYDGTVSNCYNRGYVAGNDSVAGVIGINISGNITSCYNIGEISSSNYVGGVTGNSVYAVSNCYYLDGCNSTGTIFTNTNGESITSDVFASGKVTHLLQGEQSEQIWGQKISGESKDEYPVLTSDSAKAVYKLTYSANNEGVGAYSECKADYGNSGDTVMLYEYPSYVFKGWSKTESGAMLTDSEYTITEDVTLYSLWKRRSP